MTNQTVWEMPPEPGPQIQAVRITNPHHEQFGQRWNRLPIAPPDAPELAAYFTGVWAVDPATPAPPQMLPWRQLLAYAGRLEACEPTRQQH